MTIRDYLLKIGFLGLNAGRMKDFIVESNGNMIRWAFKNGRYDVRKLAVEYFAQMGEPDAVVLLRKAMHDETELVSNAAMNSLEGLMTSNEIQKEIFEKRQFWKTENEYREGRRNRQHRKTSVMVEPKERGSKKSLDNARNMLKKPMNGGKWF